MKKEPKDLLSNFLYLLVVLAVILSVANIFILTFKTKELEASRELLKEQLRPATLKITKITFDCKDCFDIDKVIDELKKQNVNITEESVLSLASATDLIKKYNIQKLPTFILTGEINKTDQLRKYLNNIGNIEDNEFVFTGVKAPYYDVNKKNIVGRVSIINIFDSTCEKCSDLSYLGDALRKSGVAVIKEESFDYNSKEGKELIKKYEIKRIPAILISAEIDAYEIKKGLAQLNLTAKGDFYTIHTLFPPYRDLENNKVIGLVDVIMLSDKTCKDCFDVNINKQILLRFGIVPRTEKSYDIESKEGIELKNKYKIFKVPSLLLSPEANVYKEFVNAWDIVGSVEDDSWYVMRKPEAIGTYKDLETKEVIEVK